MKRVRRYTQLALVLAAALLMAAGCNHAPKVLKLGGDFTLTDQDGQPFELSSLHGKAVLIFFGYTTCPDACPITMSKIASVYRQLGPDASRLKTVYISVDTQRDTPPVLKQYLTNFKNVEAIGLTGTVPEIKKVTAMYGASYEIDPVPGTAPDKNLYTVAHTTDIYLLDAQGRMREILDYDESVADMTKGVRAVL